MACSAVPGVDDSCSVGPGIGDAHSVGPGVGDACSVGSGVDDAWTSLDFWVAPKVWKVPGSQLMQAMYHKQETLETKRTTSRILHTV